jgi:hypothetical protein
VSDLSALAVGDDIVVCDSRRIDGHRKVAKVGRVWLTDDQGSKFRIADGRGEKRLQYGSGFRAMTVPDWEAAEEVTRLTERLSAWDWDLRRRKLTLGQLRRAAQLLSEFESEGTGGLL